MTLATSDFLVCGQGSVTLLQPLSEAATAWADDKLPDRGLRYGSAIAVDERYLDTIITAIVDDGLTVE